MPDDSIRKSVSSQLGKIRSKRHLTQAETAIKAGLHPNAYAKIERGSVCQIWKRCRKSAKP